MQQILVDIWNIVLPGLPTLIGVVIGGWLTYNTTSHMERVRWEHKKRDKRLQDTRDALKQVMDWIQPILNAAHDVSMLLMDTETIPEYAEPWFEEHPMPKEWPNLSGLVAQLHPSVRFLLPGGLIKPITDIQDRIGYLQQEKKHLDECQHILDRLIAKEKECPNDAAYADAIQRYKDTIAGTKQQIEEDSEELTDKMNTFIENLQYAYDATYR